MYAWADVAHFHGKTLSEFFTNSPRERNYMVAFAETRSKMKAFDQEEQNRKANSASKGKR